MVPNWVMFAIVGGLFSQLFNFICRYILKGKDDATSWGWFYEIARLPILLFIALFDFRLQITPYSVLILAGIGITEFISVYLYMKMHQFSELSISTILYRSRLIWLPIFAFLVIGESLNLPEYIGIVLLFIGVNITVAPNKLLSDKGAIYALLGAFVTAINVLMQKMALPFASPTVILFFYSLVPVFLFPAFMKNPKQRLLKGAKQNLSLKLLAIVAATAAGYSALLALETGDVSKVNAIYQGMMVTGVIAGIIFLHERKNIFRKLLGTALAIVAIFFLT